MRFKRQARMAGWTALVLIVLWMLTATWGVSDVVARLDHNAQGLNQSLGPLRRLDFDPDIRPAAGDLEMPWYYIGNASSPFPLIVAVDHAYAVGGTAGQGSRSYVLWVFGLKILLHQDVRWMS